MAADLTPTDIRHFFRSVGRIDGGRALLADPVERDETDTPVELLDAGPSRVLATPLQVSAWMDGTQNAILLKYMEHRPLYLAHTAAGAVARRGEPVSFDWNLELIASYEDKEWLDPLRGEIPLHELPVSTPPEVEKAAMNRLSSKRAKLEREMSLRIVEEHPGVLVVDGSLVGRPHDHRVVGVVKSVGRRYLPDEAAALWYLQEGWRSPRFHIPAGSNGSGVDRFSCYVRLHDARLEAWSFGLVRLETYDPALLEPLAARALAERQFAGSGDARWDRHLKGVAAAERYLKEKTPFYMRTGI